MLVAVVLGNRLNDDASMTDIMISRLQMAIAVDKTFSPEKIIVSGGIANEKAKVSEAEKMYDYLVQHGVSPAKIVKEDKSLTTKQNAQFSVPIAVTLGATKLLVCTSLEHMSRAFLNPIKLFEKALKDYPNVLLSAYCQK